MLDPSTWIASFHTRLADGLLATTPEVTAFEEIG